MNFQKYLLANALQNNCSKKIVNFAYCRAANFLSDHVVFLANFQNVLGFYTLYCYFSIAYINAYLPIVNMQNRRPQVY